METIVYEGGATTARPALVLRWQYQDTATTWADLDLSAYSFSLTLVDTNGTTQLTKTDVTGGSGTATVTWTAGELDLSPGVYELHLAASSGGVTRHYSPNRPLKIRIV